MGCQMMVSFLTLEDYTIWYSEVRVHYIWNKYSNLKHILPEDKELLKIDLYKNVALPAFLFCFCFATCEDQRKTSLIEEGVFE